MICTTCGDTLDPQSAHTFCSAKPAEATLEWQTLAKYALYKDQIIQIIDPKPELSTLKHKCTCDFTGANCWRGCSCGGE